ncbi:MAG: hypothetical protein ND895_25570 [Pyrinomonadaceae bacterium]|nr:hypothetical protein [Pyrinomonadaceae bacterium]
MPKINWVRVIVGGLVAAVICFLSDGFLHEKLLGADWNAVYANLGANEPAPHGISLAYFAVFDLSRGLLPMFLYAMMRPYCKPGPKTAAWAGVVTWLALSIAVPAQFIPLGFFSNALWVKAGAFQLITSIVATIAGAALYKDPVTPAESPAG